MLFVVFLSFYISFLFKLFKSWDLQYYFSSCFFNVVFLFKLFFSGLVNFSGFVRPAWSIAQSPIICIAMRRSSWLGLVASSSEFEKDFWRLPQTVGIILLLHVLCKCMVNFALLTLAIFPFPCIYINKGDEKEKGFF